MKVKVIARRGDKVEPQAGVIGGLAQSEKQADTPDPKGVLFEDSKGGKVLNDGSLVLTEDQIGATSASLDTLAATFTKIGDTEKARELSQLALAFLSCSSVTLGKPTPGSTVQAREIQSILSGIFQALAG